MIVRATVRLNPDAGTPTLFIRSKKGASFRLSVNLSMRHLYLDSLIENSAKLLSEVPLDLPVGPDEWMKLEVRALGDKISIFADGKVLKELTDNTVPSPGGVQLYARAKGHFRDIEYVPLDRMGLPQ